MNYLGGFFTIDSTSPELPSFTLVKQTSRKKRTSTPVLNEPFRLEREAITHQGWAAHSACVRYLTHSAAALVKRISTSLPHLVASLTRCHMCRLPTQKLITNSTKTHAALHSFIYLSTLLRISNSRAQLVGPENKASACIKRAINLPYKSFSVQLFFFFIFSFRKSGKNMQCAVCGSSLGSIIYSIVLLPLLLY